MKTLYLLRHAKSSWNDPMLDDYDRPLNPRGMRSAPLMGDYMRAKGYRPDVVLCSSARRTLETLSLIKPSIGLDLPTLVEDGLYLASADTIIGRVQEIEPRYESALVVGHNPGLEDAVLLLCRPDQPAGTEIPRAMPTAGLAVIAFDGPDWDAVREGTGTLTDFSVPRGVSDP